MTTLAKAVGFLQAGDWQAAHNIVQDDGSTLGSWAHGIVHILEGDLANAGYWYRKAGRTPVEPQVVDDEIAALADAVGNQS